MDYYRYCYTKHIINSIFMDKLAITPLIFLIYIHNIIINSTNIENVNFKISNTTYCEINGMGRSSKYLKPN